MNHNSSAKFSFSFHLAILFHLWLIALLVLGFELNSKAEPPIEPMHATILDAAQVGKKQRTNLAENSAKAEMVARLTQKDLALRKKQALHAEKAEEEKLLSAAAQKLLALALAEEKRKQRNQLAQLHTTLENNIKQTLTLSPKKKGLNCVVRVQLNPHGRVKSAVLERASGKDDFDAAAIKAVYAADSVPMPVDKELRKAALESFSISLGNA